MKNLFLAGALTLSASAFANVCEVEMVDSRTNRIFTTIRVYDNSGLCLEGIRQCQLQVRQRGLYGVADCVPVNETTRVPNPYPHPRPVSRNNSLPVQTTSSTNTVSVVAYVRDNFFEVITQNSSEVYESCMSKISKIKNRSHMNESIFTVNGNRYELSQNESDSLLCARMEEAAKVNEGTKIKMEARISGTIKNRAFRFEGSNRSALLVNCNQAFRGFSENMVSTYQYSINSSFPQNVKVNNSLNSPSKICSSILIDMDSKL
jgi:hypothetical protein